uniref:Putative secreted protein n=1 Tax=Ixodes ricinus TaxID=34613 RepID=A0A6B0UIL5_IXORI
MPHQSTTLSGCVCLQLVVMRARASFETMHIPVISHGGLTPAPRLSVGHEMRFAPPPTGAWGASIFVDHESNVRDLWRSASRTPRDFLSRRDGKDGKALGCKQVSS